MEINKDVVISLKDSYNPQSSVSADGLTWSSGRAAHQCIRANKVFDHKYGCYFEFKINSAGDGLCGIGIGNNSYEVYGGRSSVRPTSCIYLDICNYGNQVNILFRQTSTNISTYTFIYKILNDLTNWYALGIHLRDRYVKVYFKNEVLYKLSFPSNFNSNDILNRFMITMPWDGYQGSATFNFGKNGFKYEDTAKEYYFKDYNRLYDLEDNMYGNI